MMKKSIWGVIVLSTVLLLISQAPVFAETGADDQQYFFDKHYKIDKDKGFSLDEKEKIKEKDPHYGWSLGSLYVSGYTQRTTGEKGEPVFLKNSGDQVVLGFHLDQNIDKLNGDKELVIGIDEKGHDSYFEIPETNFGRGTLIVRHTDYQNAKGKPQIYTNYLSAKSKVNANTVVELNEEGDYEVALDYVIKKDSRQVMGKSILPQYSDYTIKPFKFSVRNGNSMVFPFDCKTGEELSNKAFTPNGFRIDLAKSRYLKVFVKKEILNSDESSDTRQNRPAKDGDEFTDEGVYTITVEDPSTDQVTTKMIYVGTDDRYKAYVTTGLTLDEIDDQLAKGATIAEDGTIIEAVTEDIITEPAEPETEEPVPLPASDAAAINSVIGSDLPIIPIALVALLAVMAFAIFKVREKRIAKFGEKESGDE